MLVKKFTVYNLSALYKQVIPELMENHACLIHSPIDCSQGARVMSWMHGKMQGK